MSSFKKGGNKTAREYFKKALDKAPDDDFRKRVSQELDSEKRYLIRH